MVFITIGKYDKNGDWIPGRQHIFIKETLSEIDSYFLGIDATGKTLCGIIKYMLEDPESPNYVSWDEIKSITESKGAGCCKRCLKIANGKLDKKI